MRTVGRAESQSRGALKPWKSDQGGSGREAWQAREKVPHAAMFTQEDEHYIQDGEAWLGGRGGGRRTLVVVVVVMVVVM